MFSKPSLSPITPSVFLVKERGNYRNRVIIFPSGFELVPFRVPLLSHCRFTWDSESEHFFLQGKHIRRFETRCFKYSDDTQLSFILPAESGESMEVMTGCLELRNKGQ